LAQAGEQFKHDLPASSALARAVTMLPGVPKPILYPWFGSTHAWTVSEDNTFEALQGPFPSSTLWDEFAVETGTGRVVGTHHDGVYAFDPGKGQFRLLVPAPTGRHGGEVVSDTEFRMVYTIVHIARLGLTLVGTENGVFQLLGEGVQPLAGAGKREVGSVVTIIDLPVHRAVVLAGGSSAMAGGGPGAMLRHDDGTIDRLADTSGGMSKSPDYITKAWESRLPGRIVLRAAKTLLEVEMHPSRAGFTPGRTSTLMSSSANLSASDLVTKSGEYLVIGRTGWLGQQGLERLEADGLHTAPGERIDSSGSRNWMRELTSRGLVLIEGQGRRYSYDGSRVSLLAAADPDRIGRFLIPYDLPSIDMPIFQTERGLFELTAAGQPEPLRLPFEYGSDGFVTVSVSEFPAAHVGVIATKDNLYALSPSGVVQPIRGGAADQYSDSFAGVIPGRNVMLVRGRNSLHLIAAGSSCGTSSEQEIH